MIIIALGSNLTGKFGSPEHALPKAVNELAASGIRIVAISKIYITKAHAYKKQPDFYNAVVSVVTSLPVSALLQVLKRIEAQAGRQQSKRAWYPYFRWMPRPLDLDIVSYKGIILNWKGNRPMEHARVILPHPRAHERAFVLRPLADVAPHWHHPVFGSTPAQFLNRPVVRETGKIKRSQEFQETAFPRLYRDIRANR
ncbi:MAG: 2-amino-4-hydroxy-6-hydroxymethyldihydropteridine diphosphokinase [Rhodomicrobium sp.]